MLRSSALTDKLSRKGRGAEVTVADRGQGHQPPPEGVEEGPRPEGVVLLREVDQGGEGQDGDPDEEHEEAELLVGLVEGVDERLEAGEVPDELEDAHDPHDADEAHDLPRLAHDLKVLRRIRAKV